MQADDIIVGNCYEAKRPTIVGTLFDSYVNDRQIRWMSADKLSIQYDSPSIKLGGKYPTITMEKFLKWAAKDVTDKLPNGEWRPTLK